MVQRVQVLLIDDLDGSDAVETVAFGLDGRGYEIDLSARNAEELRKAVATWSDHGRSIGGRQRSSPRRRPSPTRVGPSNTTLRQWAKANGHDVSDRGQISSAVRQAHRAAHPDEYE